MNTNHHSRAKVIVLYRYLKVRQHTFVNCVVVRSKLTEAWLEIVILPKLDVAAYSSAE